MYKLTTFHILANHKIKEEVELNLKPFQKKVGAVSFQVLVFGKEVIILLILCLRNVYQVALLLFISTRLPGYNTYAGICLFCN